MRFLTVALSLWKWKGVIAVGSTESQFAAFAKEHGISIEGGRTSAGRAYVELGKPWLLWIETLDDVAALAHEALHIASGVLECRGLKHVAESEEAYTYTMEAIIRVALMTPSEQWISVGPGAQEQEG